MRRSRPGPAPPRMKARLNLGRRGTGNRPGGVGRTRRNFESDRQQPRRPGFKRNQNPGLKPGVNPEPSSIPDMADFKSWPALLPDSKCHPLSKVFIMTYVQTKT